MTCKHYDGVYKPGLKPNDECKAGVNYRQLVGGEGFGWITKLPCLQDFYGECAIKCESFDPTTKAYIKAEEEDFQKIMEKILLAKSLIRKIKETHHGEDWTGEEICPVCGGVLYVTHSGYSGHVRGKCSTEECLSWME